MDHMAAIDTWRGRREYVLASIVLMAKIPVTVACRLRVADVNLAAKMIWCRRRWRGKSIESVDPKPVPVPDRLVEILKAWIPSRNANGSFRVGGEKVTGIGSVVAITRHWEGSRPHVSPRASSQSRSSSSADSMPKRAGRMCRSTSRLPPRGRYRPCAREARETGFHP